MGIAVGEGLWQSAWASDEISGADCHPAQVDLAAGDLLYLPCGWFHDVTSYAEHRALNYWFHPPDQPSFEAPYSAAEFWEEEWRLSSKSLRSTAGKRAGKISKKR